MWIKYKERRHSIWHYADLEFEGHETVEGYLDDISTVKGSRREKYFDNASDLFELYLSTKRESGYTERLFMKFDDENRVHEIMLPSSLAMRKT